VKDSEQYGSAVEDKLYSYVNQENCDMPPWNWQKLFWIVLNSE